MRANIRELKDHLSTYIHDARKGIEVVITSHGVPVAKLVPILTPKTVAAPTGQQCLEELIMLDNTLKHVKLKTALSDTVIKSRQEERY